MCYILCMGLFIPYLSSYLCCSDTAGWDGMGWDVIPSVNIPPCIPQAVRSIGSIGWPVAHAEHPPPIHLPPSHPRGRPHPLRSHGTDRQSKGQPDRQILAK
ncbi:hypothetical protein QBC41DRAFT_309378 [Cercophora samala]|uniref:Secreted protein n=1 Tax=Cercophora samala TaxID=330535 RepID=A0AA39ZP27_9PEZI|nr:hypothetical protein QBC41DRAFT_309378 [Cercophora samala]